MGFCEPTELDKLRAEYARQIIEHVRTKEDAQWYVDNLLLEWGGKAYRQGIEHMATRVKKYVETEIREKK